jgi:hypothetical protein
MRTQILTHKEKLQNKKRDQLIIVVLILAITGMAVALFKM